MNSLPLFPSKFLFFDENLSKKSNFTVCHKVLSKNLTVYDLGVIVPTLTPDFENRATNC